jgi:signal transduction histidine kinase
LEKAGDNIFILVIIASAGALIICFAVFYFLIAYVRKTAKHKAEIQQKEMEYQAQLFTSVVTSQEEERRLIGKELHDEVSSVLYAIKLRLKTHLTDENLSNLEAVDKVISITRNISHLLSPPEIEILGFHDSIKELCNRYSTNHNGLQIHLNDQADGFIPKEKFQLSLMLYRILQELITNTVKHANAKVISITVKNEKNVFYLLYEDDGIGISEEKKATTSLGFKNIISRLLLIKATYLFTTDKGFKFEMYLDHQHI